MTVATYRLATRIGAGARMGKIKAGRGSRTVLCGNDYDLTADQVRALEAQGFVVVERVPEPDAPVADDDSSSEEEPDGV